MELTGYITSLSDETRLFFGSILLGLPLGMLYDCFRLLRAALPHHWIGVFAEDMVFMIVLALMLEGYGLAAADGAVRYYYAVGALIGFLLYLLTVGAVTRRMMQRIRGFCTRISAGMAQGIRQIAKIIRSGFMKYHKKHEGNEKLTENT